MIWLTLARCYRSHCMQTFWALGLSIRCLFISTKPQKLRTVPEHVACRHVTPLRRGSDLILQYQRKLWGQCRALRSLRLASSRNCREVILGKRILCRQQHYSLQICLFANRYFIKISSSIAITMVFTEKTQFYQLEQFYAVFVLYSSWYGPNLLLQKRTRLLL